MEDSYNFLPPIPTGEELEEQEREAKYAILEPYRLDPRKEYQPIQFTFSYGGIGFAPLGDIVGITGQQKNGKTFAETLLMGAALKGEYMGIKCLIPSPRILYVDTEQHPRNTLLVYRRVCNIASIDERMPHEQISMLHLRGTDTDFIKEAIQLEIERYKPHLIFIDGIVDVVTDPNDMKESKFVLSEYSKLALDFNCSIWMVLHKNPNGEKMRGHLGTVLAQKASDVIGCIKHAENNEAIYYDVEQMESRNMSISKFAFAIECKTDSYGNSIALPVPHRISVKESISLDEIFKELLQEKPLSRSELKDRVMEKTGSKKSKAYELINNALSANIIYYDKVMGKAHYRGLDLPNEEELPF